MVEGTIFVVISFPEPWPPGQTCTIMERSSGGDSFALLADTLGRLLVRLTVNGLLNIHTFQPLQLDGASKAVLAVVWSPAGVSLSINGAQLISDQPGVAPHVLCANTETIPAPAPLLVDVDANLVQNPSERFFVKTLKDIDEKALAGGRYELVRAAGLLRQLLLDAQPLALMVNRKHRLHLAFTVLDYRTPLPLVPEIHWQSLDPEPWPGVATVTVDLRAFLQVPCVRTNSVEATVKDVIRACANSMGGIHFGPPEGVKEAAVIDIDDTIRAMGEEPSVTSLRGLCRVVIRALQPLACATGAVQPSIAAARAAPRS